MGTHMIGLSTLHRKLSHIITLVDRKETVIVHSGGKWLFQIISAPSMSQDETFKSPEYIDPDNPNFREKVYAQVKSKEKSK